jgi:hypothetical protein
MIYHFKKGGTMCDNYQKIVAQKVFNKRFPELNCKERAQVNTYIETRGFYAIYKHPELIKDSFGVVLESARTMERANNGEEN